MSFNDGVTSSIHSSKSAPKLAPTSQTDNMKSYVDNEHRLLVYLSSEIKGLLGKKADENDARKTG